MFQGIANIITFVSGGALTTVGGLLLGLAVIGLGISLGVSWVRRIRSAV